MTPLLISPNNIFSVAFCAKFFHCQLLFNTIAGAYFSYWSSKYNNVGIITLNKALMRRQGGTPICAYNRREQRWYHSLCLLLLCSQERSFHEMCCFLQNEFPRPFCCWKPVCCCHQTLSASQQKWCQNTAHPQGPSSLG